LCASFFQKGAQVAEQRFVDYESDSLDLTAISEADGFNRWLEVVERAGKNQLIHLGPGQPGVRAERSGFGQADELGLRRMNGAGDNRVFCHPVLGTITPTIIICLITFHIVFQLRDHSTKVFEIAKKAETGENQLVKVGENWQKQLQPNQYLNKYK